MKFGARNAHTLLSQIRDNRNVILFGLSISPFPHTMNDLKSWRKIHKLKCGWDLQTICEWMETGDRPFIGITKDTSFKLLGIHPSHSYTNWKSMPCIVPETLMDVLPIGRWITNLDGIINRVECTWAATTSSWEISFSEMNFPRTTVRRCCWHAKFGPVAIGRCLLMWQTTKICKNALKLSIWRKVRTEDDRTNEPNE